MEEIGLSEVEKRSRLSNGLPEFLRCCSSSLKSLYIYGEGKPSELLSEVEDSKKISLLALETLRISSSDHRCVPILQQLHLPALEQIDLYSESPSTMKAVFPFLVSSSLSIQSISLWGSTSLEGESSSLIPTMARKSPSQS